jgi:hypothetical protein
VRNRLSWAWLIPALICALAFNCWPQASNSAVRGVVRDPSGAVVPGATVTLTNTATNVGRTSTTNEVGFYIFPGVVSGPYRLVVEAAGMQKFEGTLTVLLQQDLNVDAVLNVGQTTTEIVVKDITPLVNTENPSIGHVLERQRIEQLPINGRAITNLLYATVPGVESSANAGMRAYGMRMGTMVFVFDGTQHNEVWEGWSQQRPPGLDAVEEFKVEINSASAKFTRPATMIVSSKSGTNQFHGALFETNRNNAIGKARQRQDTYTKAPYLNRNEFGFSAGGPVYVPGVYNGRDKTFWFTSWEATRNIAPSTFQWRVPTEAMRNGDFRDLVDSQGRQYKLYDPLTTDPNTWQRQQFAYNNIPNTIDPKRISPVTKALLAVTPLPTLPQVNPLVDINWSGLSPNWTKNWSWSTRFDHHFSEKDNFFARYTQSGSVAIYQYAGQIMLDQLAGAVNRTAPNKALSATWVHSFSPSLFSETMVSVTRDNQLRGNGDGKTDYSTNFGLPNPFKAVSYPQLTGTGISGFGYYRDTIFDSPSWYTQIQENATKIVGRHEFQFGFHFRYDILNMNNFPASTSYNWSTLATSLYDTTSNPTSPQAVPFSGNDIGNMYLGVMNYSTAFGRNYMYFRGTEYSPYFQDNWKITPRLTLNLGLRYEFRPPVREKNNAYFGFSMEDRAYVIGNDLDAMYKSGSLLPQVVKQIQAQGGKVETWKDAGMPQSLVNTNYNNFGPRLGFAYRALDGRKAFVLRGGYRISTYPIPYRSWGGVQGWNPPSQASFSYSVTNTVQSPDGLPSYGLRSAPQYIAGVNSTNAIDVNDVRTLPRGFASANYRGLDQPDGRVQDWNLTLEKDVLANTVMRVSYVGNYSGNQEIWVRYNESTPSYIWYATKKTPMPTGEYSSVATRPWDQTVYSSVNQIVPKGWSRFNGVQLELERRYAKGFAYQLFYVLGNTMMVGGQESSDYVGSLNMYMPGAVPVDIDQRIRFMQYRRDWEIPKHRVRWNFVADLPFGKGKRLGHDVNSTVDKFIGGWQLAGMGNMRTFFWSLPTSIYPTSANSIEVYGYKYPIQNCTSGVCVPGYLWWNGYIPANKINSVDANGKPNGYMGVPANYKPAATPLIPAGATVLPANAPANTVLSQYWDTNTVWIPLSNGTVQRTTFDDGLHPWRNQYLPGPLQWGMDASLFKFVNLTERFVLRFNIDMFNIFNHPNNPTSPGSDGVLSTRNSGSGARTTQLSLRLQW